jgi:cytochrome P450
MSLARRLRERLGRLAARTEEPPEPLADPLASYEELRQSGPVVQLPGDGPWVVLGHEEARTVMKDWERFSNRPYEPVDIAMLSVSPPRHTEVRRAVGPLLGADAVAAVVALAERRAPELLNPPLDVVADYARPLSRLVASELMGFDEADTAALLEANREADAAPTPMLAQFAAMDAVAPRCRAYRELARDAGDVLSTEEIGSLMRLLWVASTATSERLVAFCVLRLLHHEAVWQELMRDPNLIPSFTDEVIRLHPPEPMIFREATADVEIGAVTVPAGSSVMVCLPAANRDPKRFDEPDRLRLDRAPGRHIGFGVGPHHCIGAALSRKTVPVAVAAVLQMLPALHSLEPALPPLEAHAPERLLVAG